MDMNQISVEAMSDVMTAVAYASSTFGIILLSNARGPGAYMVGCSWVGYSMLYAALVAMRHVLYSRVLIVVRGALGVLSLIMCLGSAVAGGRAGLWCTLTYLGFGVFTAPEIYLLITFAKALSGGTDSSPPSKPPVPPPQPMYPYPQPQRQMPQPQPPMLPQADFGIGSANNSYSRQLSTSATMPGPQASFGIQPTLTHG